MFFDVFDDIADGREFFSLFIRHFDAELLFQRHDQLDGVERIRAEVFDELRLWRYLVRLHAELFNDDVLYTLVNRFVSHKLILTRLYAMNAKIVKPRISLFLILIRTKTGIKNKIKINYITIPPVHG